MIEDLKKKIDFLINIVNLLEVANLLPHEIVERARNRARINELQEISTASLLSHREKEELNRLLKEEVEFQKIFNETHPV